MRRLGGLNHSSLRERVLNLLEAMY